MSFVSVPRQLSSIAELYQQIFYFLKYEVPVWLVFHGPATWPPKPQHRQLYYYFGIW